MRPARDHLLVLAVYAVLFTCWFSPVLFGGKLLGPGDGPLAFIPDYLSHRTLWDPALGTGFPASADPQTFAWYLPALLLSWVPESFNAFVVFGFVLAAWFSYLLVFKLTENRFAGWIAGILYGFSGFMMGHTGHPPIVHTAAWIPAVLLALEGMLEARSAKWFAFGCLATGQLVISGHPQIALYGLLLAVAYAAVRGFSSTGIRSYYLRAVLMLGFGVGISAVVLVPLAQISQLGVRQKADFRFFNFARFPLRTVPILLFPGLYGGEWGSIYGEPFNLEPTEQDAYLGFLTLALASYAWVAKKHKALGYLLFGAALLALVCSFGGDTFVGILLFHVAPFNRFRCQGRFMVIVQLALAILAGIGVKELLSGISAKRALVQTGMLLLLEVAAALTVSIAGGPGLKQEAASLGVPNVSFAITQPMFLVPLVISAVSALAIFLLWRYRVCRISAVVLSLAALADMGQFGLFSTWRYRSPDRNVLEPASTAELVRSSPGRVVTIRGFLGNPAELPPNICKLWGVRSLNKYGPLAVERYDSVVGMDAGGTISGPWWKAGNRALDILGARYVLTADADIGVMERFKDVPIPEEDLGVELGESANHDASKEISFVVDDNKRFTSLALVSFLSDSEHIGQGTPVMEMRLRTASGHDTVIPVLAEENTAEFHADCGAAAGHVAATVFKKVSTQNDRANCQGTLYFARWPLPGDECFSSLELKWVAPEGGMQIGKLVLWNNETGAIQAISPADAVDSRFHLVARREFARVYENRRAMPRVWLVSRVATLNADAVLRAIQTSILPDGSTFEPSTTALVAEPVGLAQQAPDSGASAAITREENTVVEVRTHSLQPGLLVLADLYYPGWRATVNEREARIVRTNYVQRGVEVPSGDNVVRFTFHPGSFYLGIGIMLASLIGMAFTCWKI